LYTNFGKVTACSAGLLLYEMVDPHFQLVSSQMAIAIAMAHGQWVNHLIRLGSSVHDDGVSDDDVTVASALELDRTAPSIEAIPPSPIAKYKNDADVSIAISISQCHTS
jgi:hypothetical protein